MQLGTGPTFEDGGQPAMFASRVARRTLVASALGLGLAASPRAATAGLFGPDGPQGELQQLSYAASKLGELQNQLTNELKFGAADEAAMVVMRTLPITFQDTSSQMRKVLGDVPKLDEAARARATEAAAEFAKQLEGLKEACRARATSDELAVLVAGAAAALAAFLAAAATGYEVPAYQRPADFASQSTAEGQKEFAVQYFGFLSCEGQGLERIPGSNTCKDPKSGGGVLGFGRLPKDGPGAMVLDNDPLTGKPRGT